jgi:hypothetical protein
MATVIHTVGSRVWVKDGKESWLKAEVQKLEGDTLIVALEEGGELRKVPPEDAPLQNTDTRGVEVSSKGLCGATARVLASSWWTSIFSNSCTGLLYCQPSPLHAHHWLAYDAVLPHSSDILSCVASDDCVVGLHSLAGFVCMMVHTAHHPSGVLTSLCCAVQDMTRLSYLHEPGVLWNIKNRYIYDDIYTYTGSILIAVNPFAPLPHLYGPHMMDQYRGVDLGDLSPHVYAIADAAYRQMRKEFRGQSILVSRCCAQHAQQDSAVQCRQLTGSSGAT